MKARLPLFVLLLGSSLLAAGASLSPDLDPRCPANTNISGNEEWANFTIKEYEHGWFRILYVHPDPGFRGVRIMAVGAGWQHDAWFTLDNCFPGDAEWWSLWAAVWRVKNYDNNNGYDLEFVVWTGNCALWCPGTAPFLGDVTVTVAAQGPSRWRLADPWPCSVVNPTLQSSSLINCHTTHTTTPTATTTTTTPTTTITTTTPTTTITTTTPTTTIIIIVVPVMIVVAVLVVLLVVVVRRFRQRRAPEEDVRMRFQGETEVVENSLYETLDNTRRTEVVENSLYEKLDNARKPR